MDFFKEKIEESFEILITNNILPQKLNDELAVIKNEHYQFNKKSQQLSVEDFEQKDIYALRHFWVLNQDRLMCIKQGHFEPYDRVEYVVYCVYEPSDLMDALAYLFLKSFVDHIRGQFLPQWIEGVVEFKEDQLHAEKYQALSVQKNRV